MKNALLYWMGLSLAVASSVTAVAQDQATGNVPPPKVLLLEREYIKPGKSGAAHDRTESAYVQAMIRAKAPTHYIAVNSLTGRSRALYLTGYDSFAAWEKDNEFLSKTPGLAADMDRAAEADGALLDEFAQMVYTYREDLSYRASGDLSHVRYLEAAVFHGKAGKGKELEELVKLYIDLNKKAGTNANWATYELAYGGNAGTYILFSGDKSLADIDSGYGDEKKIGAILTDEDKRKIRELRAAALENEEDQLLAINPKQSYVPEAWIKADPEFWKPKAVVSTAAKSGAEEKKAAK